MKNLPKVQNKYFVEGKTLQQIAREYGIPKRTIEERWRRHRPETIKDLIKSRKRVMTLVGLTLKEWKQFLVYAGVPANCIREASLKSFIYFQRNKGRNEKEIAKALMANKGVNLEEILERNETSTV